jgi:ABC-type nitrate/sulfonate/bicarbonate transport system substrate-binding protein
MTQNRPRAEKFMRALRKGYVYMREQRDGAVDIVHKRIPKTPREAVAEDLNGSVEDQNVEGFMSLAAAQKEMALRAELLGLAPDKIPPAEKVYDFSLVQQVDRALQTAGWKPVK